MHFEYRNLPGDRGAAGVPVSPADPAFGGHIGTSYNNPFNLDLRPGQGAIGGRSYRDAHDNSAHVMGEYATMAAGIAAAYHRLEEYQAMGLTTVRQMIDKWTGHPGANYGEALAKELGVGLDAPVDIHNQDFARRFLEHMKPHENRGELDDRDVRAALGMPSAPDLHAGGHSDGGGPHARHTADIQVTVKGRTDLAEVHATAHGNLWRGPPRVVRADVGGRIA